MLKVNVTEDSDPVILKTPELDPDVWYMVYASTNEQPFVYKLNRPFLEVPKVPSYN